MPQSGRGDRLSEVATRRLAPALESALRERVGLGEFALHEMLRYHMRWVDEHKATADWSPSRPHGMICLLAAEARGCPADKAMPAAVAMEFCIASVEIESDVRLGSPTRGDRSAVWWVFGHAQGINAADGAYSLARLSLMGTGPDGGDAKAVLRSLAYLDDACLQVCMAHATQMEQTEKELITLQGFARTLEEECGALMGAAAAMGVNVSGASEHVAEGAHTFGRHLGAALAFRREADALSMPGLPESEVGALLDRNHSVPLLYALEHAPIEDVQAIQAMALREKPVDGQLLLQLVEIVERAGGRAHAEQLAEEHLALALHWLERSGFDGTDLAAVVRSLLEPAAAREPLR